MQMQVHWHLETRGSVILYFILLYYRLTGLLSTADGSHMQGVTHLASAVLKHGGCWYLTAESEAVAQVYAHKWKGAAQTVP